MPVKDWVCARCTGTGGLLTMDDVGPLCMTCADLDYLVFLGAGDAALTRRAKKASALSAVVVRWSRSRRHFVSKASTRRPLDEPQEFAVVSAYQVRDELAGPTERDLLGPWDGELEVLPPRPAGSGRYAQRPERSAWRRYGAAGAED